MTLAQHALALMKAKDADQDDDVFGSHARFAVPAAPAPPPPAPQPTRFPPPDWEQERLEREQAERDAQRDAQPEATEETPSPHPPAKREAT
jgi:hypothetical protein